jgi:hypothetical protein
MFRLLIVLLLAAALAGCGQGTGGATQPGGTVSASPTAKGELTIRGSVEAGVEAGCLILTAEDGQTYQLVGGDLGVIRPGVRLEVTGSAAPGLVTICQQGIPFKVTTAVPI